MNDSIGDEFVLVKRFCRFSGRVIHNAGKNATEKRKSENRRNGHGIGCFSIDGLSDELQESVFVHAGYFESGFGEPTFEESLWEGDIQEKVLDFA